MLDWVIMSATWICFTAAVRAQNIERQSYLPHLALAGGIGVVWKVVKGTRFQQSKETDLVSGCEFFDALPEHYCNERETDEAGTGTLRGRVMAKLF